MDSFNINSTGSKTPKALYQLAVCFQKLEKRKQMEQTLGKVIESFPGHEYAKKAEAMLEKIKKTR